MSSVQGNVSEVSHEIYLKTAQWLEEKKCGRVDDIMKIFNLAQDGLNTVKQEDIDDFIQKAIPIRQIESSGWGCGMLFRLAQKVANFAFYVFLGVLALTTTGFFAGLVIGDVHVIGFGIVGSSIYGMLLGISLLASKIMGSIDHSIINHRVRHRLKLSHSKIMQSISSFDEYFQSTEGSFTRFSNHFIDSYANGKKEKTTLKYIEEMNALISGMRIKLMAQKEIRMKINTAIKI